MIVHIKTLNKILVITLLLVITISVGIYRELNAVKEVNEQYAEELIEITLGKTEETIELKEEAIIVKEEEEMPELEVKVKPYSFHSNITAYTFKEYLNEIDSSLKDSKRCSIIVEEALVRDIDPILMIALVLRNESALDEKDNTRFLSNPFGVYGGWNKYSTNLRDSTRICAVTLANYREDYIGESGLSLLEYFNLRYAESDTEFTWAHGVEEKYIEIQQYLEKKEGY